jgi:hypothetical protein
LCEIYDISTFKSLLLYYYMLMINNEIVYLINVIITNRALL